MGDIKSSAKNIIEYLTEVTQRDDIRSDDTPIEYLQWKEEKRILQDMKYAGAKKME